MAAMAALAAASAAQARVYDFSYFAAGGPSGDEFGSGVITLSNTEAQGGFAVLGVTGFANNSKIVGLSNYAGADNIVYAGEPFLSQGGVSIANAAGTDYNLYSLDGIYAVLSSVTTPYAWASNSSPLRRLCVTLEPASAAPA